jgi:predicted small lipoprotein YifL
LSSSSKIWAMRGVVTATLVTVAAGIGLAGCGRKGGLDPPPLATPAASPIVQPGAAPQDAAVAETPPPPRQ